MKQVHIEHLGGLNRSNGDTMDLCFFEDNVRYVLGKVGRRRIFANSPMPVLCDLFLSDVDPEAQVVLVRRWAGRYLTRFEFGAFQVSGFISHYLQTSKFGEDSIRFIIDPTGEFQIDYGDSVHQSYLFDAAEPMIPSRD